MENIEDVIITNEVEFTLEFMINLLSVSDDSKTKSTLSSTLLISEDLYDTIYIKKNDIIIMFWK